MDYRIISADATIGQIQVTYSNSGTDIATYAIDVPIVEGAFLTGDALVAEIQSRAPVWLVERKSSTSTATGFDTIVELARPEREAAAARVAAAQAAAEASLTYAQKRRKEYPPITDCLDGVVKGDQAQIDKYIADCQAVKAKYPKP
jgi:hypothetical protein